MRRATTSRRTTSRIPIQMTSQTSTAQMTPRQLLERVQLPLPVLVDNVAQAADVVGAVDVVAVRVRALLVAAEMAISKKS